MIDKKAALKQYTHELENKKSDAERYCSKIAEEFRATLQALNEELELVNEERLEQEKLLAPLVELLEQNPEEQRQQTQTSIHGFIEKV